MNPRIQALSVNGLYPSIVKHIIVMPTLKHLSFRRFYARFFIGKEFVVKSVTNLTITDAWWSPGENVRFPNSQQLEIEFEESNYHEWMNFFHEQTDLKRFHLNHTGLQDNQFNDITSTMHNIEEVSISSKNGRTIPAAAIIRFTETHQQLMKLCLESCDDADKETLKMRFSRD